MKVNDIIKVLKVLNADNPNLYNIVDKTALEHVGVALTNRRGSIERGLTLYRTTGEEDKPKFDKLQRYLRVTILLLTVYDDLDSSVICSPINGLVVYRHRKKNTNYLRVVEEIV